MATSRYAPNSKARRVVGRVPSWIAIASYVRWRQTVTFDNGTEFALHYRLHDLDIQTFFCDTYSPWQKGGVENAIGRMRRTLPRRTNLVTLSDERFTQLIQAYNNTPRKCLDRRSPAEVFWIELWHFKCESTPPRTRG